MRTYGIIGFPLLHSHSPSYFTEKFIKQKIVNTQYLAFPLEDIEELPELLKSQTSICGLNVTIPHKESVIHYLDSIDSAAKFIGAVNTILINRSENDYQLVGYNTDAYGFTTHFQAEIQTIPDKALILGSGGASKAVKYSLTTMGIDSIIVSRNPTDSSQIRYKDITKEILISHKLIINTTPLGMYPEINDCPDLPYHFLNEENILYDLVYNPFETLFLKKGKEQGSRIFNGKRMFELQAEESWEIWNKH